MVSNEHPDMSGNPMDEPLRCHQCDVIIEEEDAIEFCGEFYCSGDCYYEALEEDE